MRVPFILTLSFFGGGALATSKYAPVSATCPSISLVRAASGLSDSEETYRVARKAIADEALKTCTYYVLFFFLQFYASFEISFKKLDSKISS
jgi:hypothetical protein